MRENFVSAKRRATSAAGVSARYGFHFGPVGENVVRFALGELDDAAQQFALVSVDAAALLDLFDKHQQLLLRHFVSASSRSSLAISRFHWENRKLTGVSSHISRRSSGAENIANFRGSPSQCFWA